MREVDFKWISNVQNKMCNITCYNFTKNIMTFRETIIIDGLSKTLYYLY